MTNHNDTQTRYNPQYLGTKPRGFSGNKGKQMQDKTGKTPIIMQTKGE